MHPPNGASVSPSIPPWRAWVVIGTLSATIFANCLLWSCKLPFDGAPDERDHYAVIRFAAHHGRLPLYGEGSFQIHLVDTVTGARLYPRATGQAGVWAYRVPPNHRLEVRPPFIYRASTSYLLAAWFTRLLGGFTLHRARAFSALCVALSSALAGAIGVRLRPEQPWLGALAALGVGYWPQATFVGAYLNEDAFALLAVASTLYACVLIETGPLDWRRACLLGLGLGLVAQSKLNAWGAFPIVAIWGGLQWRRRGRDFVRLALIAAVIAVSTGGWWLLRNTLVYQGDPLGYRTEAALDAFWRALPPALAAQTGHLGADSFRDLGIPLRKMFQIGWLPLSLKSFFGVFGWMNKPMPEAWHRAALGLAAAALLAGFAALGRGSKARLPTAAWLFSLPLFALLLSLSAWNSYTYAFQAQGRYLLSALPGLWLQMAVAGPSSRLRLAPPLAIAVAAFAAAANFFAFGVVLK